MVLVISVPVKSRSAHEDFLVGRRVESALHHEDGSDGWVIGYVEDADVKIGDEIITDEEYEVLKLAIQAYNAALPPEPPPVPSRLEVLLGKVVDDTATLQDVREILRLERGL